MMDGPSPKPAGAWRKRLAIGTGLLLAAGAAVYMLMPQLPIFGGDKVPQDQYPWHVALVAAHPDHVDGLFCGGTVISSRWVLTAAHCLYDHHCARKPKTSYYIGYGSVDLKEVQLASIEDDVPHEKHKCGAKPNDIALLLLDKPIAVAQTARLPGPTDSVKYNTAGQTLTIAGWGWSAPFGWKSRLLQDVGVPVIDRDSCKARYGATLPDAAICAGETGKDACRYDSGGALFAREGTAGSVQLGIVSFGDGCGEPNTPGVYTDVAAYRVWIEKTVSAKQAANISQPR